MELIPAIDVLNNIVVKAFSGERKNVECFNIKKIPLKKWRILIKKTSEEETRKRTSKASRRVRSSCPEDV